MRIFTLFFIFFTSSIIAYGQAEREKVSVASYPKFKADERAIPIDLIGQDTTGYYLQYSDGKYGSNKTAIVKFDKNFIPTDKKLEIAGFNDDEKSVTIAINKVGKDLFHFFTIRKKRKVSYYYHKINLSKMDTSSRTLIMEVNDKHGQISKSEKLLIFSPDSSKIALTYITRTQNLSSQFVEVSVFDNTLKKLKKLSYYIPYQQGQFIIHGNVLTNSGEYYMLVKKHIREENPEEYKGFYLIYHLNDAMPNIIDEIVTTEHFFADLHLTLNEQNKIIVAGFYSNKDFTVEFKVSGGFSSWIKGVFYYRIDINNHKVEKEVFTPFSESFFTQLLEEKKALKTSTKFKKGKLEAKNFELQKIINYSNGDMALIAEEIKVTTTPSTAPGGAGVSVSVTIDKLNYTYYDLAIIRINKDGEIIWATKVAKNSVYLGKVDFFSYHYSFLRSNDIFIIYNDNIANIKHTTGKVARAFDDGTALIMLKIDSNGNYARQILRDELFMEGHRFRPALNNKINNNRILLFSQGETNLKSQKFLTLEFE
ncbi:MAG: hypothetical protein L3J06_00410 [Cyclobacteriaceae bacterium]|nr:hypothetical protein [Cyclobacteriaceae bacterium]